MLTALVHKNLDFLKIVENNLDDNKLKLSTGNVILYFDVLCVLRSVRRNGFPLAHHVITFFIIIIFTLIMDFNKVNKLGFLLKFMVDMDQHLFIYLSM